MLSSIRQIRQIGQCIKIMHRNTSTDVLSDLSVKHAHHEYDVDEEDLLLKDTISQWSNLLTEGMAKHMLSPLHISSSEDELKYFSSCAKEHSRCRYK